MKNNVYFFLDDFFPDPDEIDPLREDNSNAETDDMMLAVIALTAKKALAKRDYATVAMLATAYVELRREVLA